MNNTPILSFIGYSNSGKTTLICKILREISNEYKVVVIKHHGHIENKITSNVIKDTDKFLQFGAYKTFLLIGDEKPKKIIDELLDQNLDLIILEGFKMLDYPKLYVKRMNNKDLKEKIVNVIGTISEEKTIESKDRIWFNIDDITSIVDFIKYRFLKGE